MFNFPTKITLESFRIFYDTWIPETHHVFKMMNFNLEMARTPPPPKKKRFFGTRSKRTDGFSVYLEGKKVVPFQETRYLFPAKTPMTDFWRFWAGIQTYYNMASLK